MSRLQIFLWLMFGGFICLVLSLFAEANAHTGKTTCYYANYNKNIEFLIVNDNEPFHGESKSLIIHIENPKKFSEANDYVVEKDLQTGRTVTYTLDCKAE